MIEELINEANEEKKILNEKIKNILFKIEEEIKEIGVPLVLQPLNPFYNLPKQLKVVDELWNQLLAIKEEMNHEKERLFKACLEMYREEMESQDFQGEPLPNWIHELFDNPQMSFNEEASFTTAAISHLDAAIDQLDPFYPSLSGSLARIETAHEILKSRLELFKVEYEAIWKEIKVIFDKLQPFALEEVNSVEKETDLITNLMLNQNDKEAPTLTRSILRKVLNEWKRIEKERNESISGSILLIGRLWNLLETCPSERFPLNPSDLSLKNMKILSEERHRLINFQQQKFKELYDSQVVELEKLMTALRWNETRKQEILSNCQSYTADGLQFLSCQLAVLQPKLELSLNIISSISSRYALINKMREFEKSASDPARLFRSSFQLLQEEKFRKTAFPTLLNLESQIKTQLNDYKLKFEEDFIYYNEITVENDTCCYLQILEEEISSRFMSSGIFGFDQTKQRKERQSSISNNNANVSASSNTPRYAANSSNNTSSAPVVNRKVPSIGSSNVIPQRRKLDK